MSMDVEPVARASASEGAGKELDEQQLMAVSICIDELRHRDPQIRLRAFKNVTMIADALGPVRTRTELIPHIMELVDDGDEILLALAEELKKLRAYVGGPEFVYMMMQPLETLSAVEESVVHDKAVESIVELVKTIPDHHITEHVVPMIERLGGADWYTSRISACNLICPAYARLLESKDQESKSKQTPEAHLALRKLFLGLCADETPMVRRVACSNLGTFVELLPLEVVRDELLGAFEKLAEDDQDSVRLLSIDSCVALSNCFRVQQPDVCVQRTVPLMFNLCHDKGWRVRYVVAREFGRLAASIEGIDEAKRLEFHEGFVRLLQDGEAEVRTAAAANVGAVAKLMGGEVALKRLIGPIQALSSDSSQYVRAALGSVVLDVCLVLDKQDVFDQLLPIFLQLLRDQDPEVRLNIIGKLGSVKSIIGIDVLSDSLLPTVVELALDPNWRVRLAIIKLMPGLASQVGKDLFDKHFSDICMSWLGDQVFTIRRSAATNLSLLSKLFGVEWSKVQIAPKIVSLGTTEVFAPLIVKLTSDPVANVRFSAARTLGRVAPEVSEAELKAAVVPCLQALESGLAGENDPEVRFFATRSLTLIRDGPDAFGDDEEPGAKALEQGLQEMKISTS
jgi:serine/threonine-protein phosphatase 2A regulatory subunit A